MEKVRFPLVMKSIAAVTTLCFIALSAVYMFFPFSCVFTLAITFGTTAYHFLMRLAVGYLVPKATGYDFDFHTPWFRPRKWETAFYHILNVRSWKGRLPTYAPEQYSLKRNTLSRVIQNTCGAEIVHEIIMVLSFLPLLTVPALGAFPVFFLTSVLAALYDSLFVIAQRYNRPRLIRIYKKQEAKAHE